MMAAVDVTENGQRLLCANWWKPDVQDFIELDFEDVIDATSFAQPPQGFKSKDFQMDVLPVLIDKLEVFLQRLVMKYLEKI